ncbi:DUF6462 family protein [Butyrivibrio sp. AE2015]|uniref:DUF6462 family protein n=1 Tax=Butyrivibrio sp. AE2015 TaxID=1280663 RepID=UPI0003B3D634|nr:DUF6462 family protein [Butyrivibrio sp. AE2015]
MENTIYKRLVNVTELRAYTGLGKNKAVEFAKSSGAEVRIGRRVLFDLTKLNKAIDELGNKGQEKNDA